MSEKDNGQTQERNEWVENRIREIKREYGHYFREIAQYCNYISWEIREYSFHGYSPKYKHDLYTREWSKDKKKSPRIMIAKMEYLKRLHAMPTESAVLIYLDIVDQIVKDFLPINDVQVIVEYLLDDLWYGLDEICLTEYDGEELKYLKQLTWEGRRANSMGEKTIIAEKVIKLIGRENMRKPIADNIRSELRAMAEIEVVDLTVQVASDDMDNARKLDEERAQETDVSISPLNPQPRTLKKRFKKSPSIFLLAIPIGLLLAIISFTQTDTYRATLIEMFSPISTDFVVDFIILAAGWTLIAAFIIHIIREN